MQDQHYFSVTHQLNVNLELIEDDNLPSSYSEFEALIPEPFILANSSHHHGLLGLRALKQLGEAGEQLLAYLQAQEQKLNRVLSYVLVQQDSSEHRTTSHQFGGSEIHCFWDSPLKAGQMVRLKIFLPEESSAVFCYGQVQGSQSVAHSQQQLLHINYHWIRDEDIETLVRASLHVQSQQLKARADARLLAEKK
ncbi:MULTISPECIES: PilZ domain-containing protein [unclassified Agarivorans]|uniref:PilZ domain-containing protein n=1 Tax=unclassified Agarivorans TaxID=2636026 RepID=UPI003D7CEBD4